MTKENQLIKEYASISIKTNEALSGIKDALKAINDTSVLHAEALERQTKAIEKIESSYFKLFFVLLVILAMLAGLEKFGSLLGL